MKDTKSFVFVYGWLFLAMLSLFLSGGDRPIEIAVWLCPLFLLRFFREVKPWKAPVLTLPCMVAVTLLSDKGMTPLPMTLTVALTVINSAITLFPYLTDRLFGRSLPQSLKTLLFPFVAIAVEVFLGSSFRGGTWGNAAYGIQDLAMLQLVSVTGLWGMMFFIYWFASVINEIWEHRHRLGDIKRLFIVFIATCIFIYGFGVYRLHYKKSSNNTARVAGVSPGPEHRVEMMKIFEEIFSADRSGSIDMGSMRAVMETKFHELLSESIKLAESGVEIIVWAEGAAVIFASDEEKYVEQAVYTSQEKNFYLGMSLVVLCDNYQDLLAKNQPIVKNKLLFITPENRVAWEYSKSNLVLGNEKAVTIPGDGVLKSTKTNKGTVTGAICYDMDFPRYIRQAGVINSDLLIAPSNDWPEIKNTHARMARLRAIENGISLLRPTSNGISIAVDPYGNIMSVVDDNKSTGDPLVAVLPMGSVKTLYAFVGDSWTMICVILGSVLIVLGIARRLREKQLNQGLL